MSRRFSIVALLAGALLLAGCGTSEYAATPLPAQPSANPSASPSAGPTTAAPACTNALESYAPVDQLPDSARLNKIRRQGRLIAGVSADSLLLGARNPVNNAIEGFDIEMLKLVADAIFGDPNRLELRVITSAQRIPVLTAGTVDIVARNMTINCARWEQIAFSAEYYHAGQKVLVPTTSDAETLNDLNGKRVCAPAASTSLEKLKEFKDVVAVQADTHTGCLVMFQQGGADAITGDDTVLAGLVAQDPYAKVTKAKAFTAEPYGLGMSKNDPNFVRYVNKVLEDAKADGRWKAAYDRWLAEALGPAPAPPKPVYGR
jgi:polar amino acid transport system substrate-binding protein